MEEKIEQIRQQFTGEINLAKSEKDLDMVRIKFLGRKGLIAGLFDNLKSVPADQRPHVGKLVNELRTFAQSSFEERKKALLSEGQKDIGRFLDLSLPGRRRWIGSKHPLTQTLEDIIHIFTGMGFEIALGPEIEDDYHNFEALNFPRDHPARDMQDTFFISDQILMRTHTSPVQIRVMERQKPPVRVIIPGRVYRNEAISARSYCVFHQVEGLYVDEGVTLSELKGTLVAFAKQFYGSSVKYKFRPTFF